MPFCKKHQHVISSFDKSYARIESGKVSYQHVKDRGFSTLEDPLEENCACAEFHQDGSERTNAIVVIRDCEITVSARHAELPGVVIENSVLTGLACQADMQRAQITNSSLRNVDLSNTRLSSTELSNARFESAVMRGMSFDGTNATEVSFNNVSTEHSSFEGAAFENCKFMHTDMSSAQFNAATLSSCDFNLCKISDVEFSGARLTNVRFIDGVLQIKKFDNARFVECSMNEVNFTASGFHARFELCEMKEASFDKMSFSGCRFDGSDLSDAKFVRSSLIGSSFTGANLTRADFSLANLNDCDLTGCDLTGAKLYRTRYNHNTVWPAGFPVPETAFRGQEETAAQSAAMQFYGDEYSRRITNPLYKQWEEAKQHITFIPAVNWASRMDRVYRLYPDLFESHNDRWAFPSSQLAYDLVDAAAALETSLRVGDGVMPWNSPKTKMRCIFEHMRAAVPSAVLRAYADAHGGYKARKWMVEQIKASILSTRRKAAKAKQAPPAFDAAHSAEENA